MKTKPVYKIKVAIFLSRQDQEARNKIDICSSRFLAAILLYLCLINEDNAIKQILTMTKIIINKLMK